MPPTPQGRMIAREQGVPRPKVCAFRPRHNIIGPKLCNRLPPSSLAPKTSIRRGKNARKKALQASDYTISIMLRSCVRARWNKSASTLSVEAAGNCGLPSGTNGLQVRRKAQDFRRWVRRACSSNECQ